MPTTMPTLGLNLPYDEGAMDGATPRWADILAMAQAAEAMGFDALWISDHVGFEREDGSWQGAWDCWTLLSALAAATSRVRLGPYVLAVPYRNPALLAKMAETLDEVSGGRLILGLGAGWNRPEFDAYGFPWERRFDRFEEALRIITSMLRTGEATLDGAVERARNARLTPRGPRPNGLPVMVGAGGPRMLRLTAELADDWNAGLESLDEVRRLIAALDAACASVGRDPATLTRSAEILVRVGDAPAHQPRHAQELRGVGEAVSGIRALGALGISHIQVQVRPRNLAGVDAFRPVLDALAGAAP